MVPNWQPFDALYVLLYSEFCKSSVRCTCGGEEVGVELVHTVCCNESDELLEKFEEFGCGGVWNVGMFMSPVSSNGGYSEVV